MWRKMMGQRDKGSVPERGQDGGALTQTQTWTTRSPAAQLSLMQPP